MENKVVILFDGMCKFCMGGIRFIKKQDTNGYFKIISMQSQIGKDYLQKLNLTTINTIIVITEDAIFTKSDAALAICRHLSGLWSLLYLLRYIRKGIRDKCYDIIAVNRYRWFGRRKNIYCQLTE